MIGGQFLDVYFFMEAQACLSGVKSKTQFLSQQLRQGIKLHLLELNVWLQRLLEDVISSTIKPTVLL